tara:strand:+ start:943 stop:1389 length:447 start_codon:yes stop_codon:yes gene_type:complete
MSDNKVGAGMGIILLKDNTKILFGKRHIDPDKADSEMRGEGTWTLPGGKIEYQESFEETAIREVKEETDIDVKDCQVICVNNNKNKHAHFVTIGLYSDNFKGEPSVMEPDEITEWQWFDLDKLPDPMFFPSANIIENFKRKMFYIKRE